MTKIRNIAKTPLLVGKSGRIAASVLLVLIGIVSFPAAAAPQDSLRTGFDQFVTGDSVRSASLSNSNKNTQNVQRIESFKLIKRAIDYKEQITVAMGMMIFIAVMFTTAQAWNPN